MHSPGSSLNPHCVLRPYQPETWPKTSTTTPYPASKRCTDESLGLTKARRGHRCSFDMFYFSSRSHEILFLCVWSSSNLWSSRLCFHKQTTFFKWYSHFRIQGEKIIFADSFNRNLVICRVSIEISPLFYQDIIREIVQPIPDVGVTFETTFSVTHLRNEGCIICVESMPTEPSDPPYSGTCPMVCPILVLQAVRKQELCQAPWSLRREGRTHLYRCNKEIRGRLVWFCFLM